jgi:hypothetical protein
MSKLLICFEELMLYHGIKGYNRLTKAEKALWKGFSITGSVEKEKRLTPEGYWYNSSNGTWDHSGVGVKRGFSTMTLSNMY